MCAGCAVSSSHRRAFFLSCSPSPSSPSCKTPASTTGTDAVAVCLRGDATLAAGGGCTMIGVMLTTSEVIIGTGSVPPGVRPVNGEQRSCTNCSVFQDTKPELLRCQRRLEFQDYATHSNHDGMLSTLALMHGLSQCKGHSYARYRASKV